MDIAVRARCAPTIGTRSLLGPLRRVRRTVAQTGRVAFGQIDGGVLCRNCRAGKRQVVMVSAGVLRTMAQLADTESTAWRRLQIDPPALGELRRRAELLFRRTCWAAGQDCMRTWDCWGTSRRSGRGSRFRTASTKLRALLNAEPCTLNPEHGQGCPSMSIAGARRWLAACAFLSLPAAAQVSPRLTHPTAPGNGDNEYNGWLFNSLTGHPAGGSQRATGSPVPPTSAPTAQPIAPANVSAAGVPLVQPVPPANLPTPQPVPPAGDEVGPMIPGPGGAAQLARDTAGADSGIIPVAAEVAGPPPSVPPDLPPPTNSMSIVGVKPDKPEEEKKKGFEFSDLTRRTFGKTMRKATGHGPDEKIARAAMQDGISVPRQEICRGRRLSSPSPPTAGPTRRWKRTRCSSRARASSFPTSIPRRTTLRRPAKEISQSGGSSTR